MSRFSQTRMIQRRRTPTSLPEEKTPSRLELITGEIECCQHLVAALDFNLLNDVLVSYGHAPTTPREVARIMAQAA